MPQQKILPYNKPIYCTYNFMGSLEVCANNDKQFDYWVLNNYTTWTCKKADTTKPTQLVIKIPYSEIWRTPPFFYRRVFAKKYIKTCYSEVFKALLDDDHYIYFTNVDDYYIKTKPSYKGWHFGHDGVIFGYDNTKKVYHAAAYTNKKLFENFEIPMGDFGRGWYSKYINHGGDGGSVLALKPNPYHGYEFDIDKINIDIKNYLTSIPNERCEKDDICGINIYNELDVFLNMVVEGEHKGDDTRLFRIFNEHKKSMFDRLSFLADKSIISTENAQSYKELLDLADLNRMLHLKYTMTRKIDLVKKIKDNIREISFKENEMLSRI